MTEDIAIKNTDWERETLHKLLFGTLKEQRCRRRWKTFFWLLFFGYIFFMTWMWIYKDKTDLYTAEPLRREHTAVINIIGEIFDKDNANAEDVIDSLQNAYAAKNCRGIILRINSPGGSGVQANQIYKEINRLRATRADLPIYAVIEDLGTSAAYWIASATDQIYADEVSLVGSIGVLINSFGFVNAMEKIGIERRLYTAGKHKGMLDPFSPANAEDTDFIKQQLDNVHKKFIASVKAGRKGKLADDDNIYSGCFWTGDMAKTLGIIDEFGDVNYVAREVIHASKVIDYTVGGNVLDRLAKKVGAAVGEHLLPKANAIKF
jgi:protease-4